MQQQQVLIPDVMCLSVLKYLLRGQEAASMVTIRDLAEVQVMLSFCSFACHGNEKSSAVWRVCAHTKE
jgi:hypothetical protein